MSAYDPKRTFGVRLPRSLHWGGRGGAPLQAPFLYPAQQSIVANLVASVGMHQCWGAFVRAAYRRWLQLRQRSFAKQQFSKADVAVGSKGDMSECPRSVRLVRPAGTIAISDWLVITG
jgi:hypothetical protein